MRVSRIVSAVSWKYAVGEILLIVIGVTLALAVNSWATTRQRRVDEVKILEQLSLSLDKDRVSLEETVTWLQDTADGLKALRQHLAERRPYSNELDKSFALMTMFAGGSINVSAYESLKSRGLDLISNDELRVQLVSVFERDSEQVDNVGAIFRDEVMAFWRGPAVTRFELRSAVPAVAIPYDYQSLLDDRQFDSLLMQRITLTEGYLKGVFRDATADVDDLRSAIEDELARLR
jgi:hypothetical protein